MEGHNTDGTMQSGAKYMLKLKSPEFLIDEVIRVREEK